jgi:hypothetical protein
MDTVDQTQEASVEERVNTLSSPLDLYRLHKEIVENHAKAVEPLVEQYNNGLKSGEIGTSLMIAKQVAPITRELVEGTKAVEKRMAVLFPDAESVVKAASGIEDPGEQFAAVRLWAMAKANTASSR